eukprot:COSAG05_NODE_2434_length_3069_cov_2.536364_1_plen_156_part_00
MLKGVMSTVMGMSGPQMVLTGGVVAGYVQWSYSSAAQLQDHMETQVYGYPLRMEDEVKELHKLAELQKSKDEFMASRQAEEGKAAIKSRWVHAPPSVALPCERTPWCKCRPLANADFAYVGRCVAVCGGAVVHGLVPQILQPGVDLIRSNKDQLI